jgi:LDH2 family malate/lactate/ureidoglycolate dehydrogenase
MAGHKGAGLALVIDVLCGVLTGAAFGPHIGDLYDEGGRQQNVGHLFAALSVESFAPIAVFKQRMDELVREVRAQPTQAGVPRIYVPGEIEQEKAEISARLGVALGEVGWRQLDQLAKDLGLEPLSVRVNRDE